MRTERVDYSDLKSVIKYADNLGPGTVVYKHPMRGAFSVCHKARTDLYDMSWVAYEARRPGEPRYIPHVPSSESPERQSLEDQDNERIRLKPSDYVD